MSFNALEMRDRPAIVPIRFWTDYEPDPTDSTKTIAHDKVEWVKKGSSNASTTVMKIRHLKQDNLLWPILEPAYEAWKKNQEAPVDGTPLDVWPGVTPQQVKIMRDYNLRSVEDFATAPDSVLMRMHLPGIRELQGRAQAFLKAGEGQAQIAEALSSRDRTISQLVAEVEEMKRAMQDMPQPEKRGPGRPPGSRNKPVEALDTAMQE
jgi:hypothetical protein